MVYTKEKAVKNMATIEESLEVFKTQQQTIDTLTVKLEESKSVLLLLHLIY